MNEQKKCRKRSRAAKDRLMTNKAILRNTRMKKCRLSMGWIDYWKAYGIVPLSCIIELLKEWQII